jgi:methylated-DNA-protein-cysteine methyltransferase-like protein
MSNLNLKSQNPNLFEKVYRVVGQIPAGKVMTYGQVAGKVNSLRENKKISPRFVGWALHANRDGSKVPCHRVVNKDGRLAPGYAFGGPDEQKNRLIAEGVKFRDADHVDSGFIMTP